MHNTRTVLTIGFLAVLGLMALLAGVGLTVLKGTQERIDTVVHTHNLKTELLVQMRTAARERTVSLLRMAVLEDPFARDEEAMRFYTMGAEFITARDALREKPMSAREDELLAELGVIAGRNGPLQREVAELFMNGRIAEGRRLLFEQVVPMQDTVFRFMSQLIDIQKAEAAKAVQEVQAGFTRTLTVMVLLGSFVTIICLLIARHVIRRTAEAEHRLRAEKEQAQVTLHSIGDGVITTDAEGCVLEINDTAELLTGWSAEVARGVRHEELFRIVRETDRRSLPDPVNAVLANGGVIASEGDTLLLRRDGSDSAIEYTVAPIFHGGDVPDGTVLVFRDVTEMRALSHQLIYQARHDALTGLHNRREMEARIQQVLAEIRASGRERSWLCYIDLDQFKLVNDTCGHLAGDELLKQVAEVLRLQVRDTDMVARMGGDEFAVLIRRCPLAEAKIIVERIVTSVNELRFAWGTKSFSTSASVGLVPVDVDSGSLYDLLSAADTACYVAKDEGRNRIHVYQRDDDALARREVEMEMVHRINRALEDDRFVLHCQPIEPLGGREARPHLEILVRMLDEEGGLLPPMAFIPAAERYNLMGRVDRLVIDRTLDLLRSASADGASRDWVICINLSAQSLCEDGFLEHVLERLKHAPVGAEDICFEITETTAITNLSRAVRLITALKERGCRFALDDFGSGLSSFGYLKNLPVDYLKIDGSFVRDILDDPIDFALVESISQIGRIMGIDTIAEYVETEAVREALERMGVDFAQGYGIARPLPLTDMLAQGAADAAASARRA